MQLVRGGRRSSKSLRPCSLTTGCAHQCVRSRTRTGLLKGSLYHHFDSKDAILVELVGRYYAEMNLIGEEALHRLERSNARTVVEHIERLSTDIANCAVAHRAALQMTFYDSPS